MRWASSSCSRASRSWPCASAAQPALYAHSKLSLAASSSAAMSEGTSAERPAAM
jgi:hypothetical protein